MAPWEHFSKSGNLGADSTPANWSLMRDAGYFRNRDKDPRFYQMRKELGDASMSALAQAGAEELLERRAIHHRLNNLLGDPLVALGIHEPALHENIVPSHHFHVALHESFYRESTQAGGDLGLRAIEDYLELHPSDSRQATLRRACIARGAWLRDQRSQAMTSGNRRRLGEPADYVRGQTNRESVATKYSQDMLDYYGLDATDPRVISFLTNSGILAPSLAIFSLYNAYSNLKAYFIGLPYFEIGKSLDRRRNLGIQSPHSEIVRSLDTLRKQLDEDKATQSPVMIYCQPIGSNPDMQVTDMQKLIRLASTSASDSKQIFVVCDITANAGQFQFPSAFQSAVEESNVNIIAAQSLLKYFSWGQDISQGGSVIGFGRAFEDPDLRRKFIDTYKMNAMDIDVTQLADQPPIDKEYMDYRARRIERNAMLLATSLHEKFATKGVNITYPGLDPVARPDLDFSGFLGSYFFVTFESEMQSQRFMDIIENEQPEGLGYIDSGFSFGFDATRVSKVGSSIRVVPGTEDIFMTKALEINLRNTLSRVFGK